MLTDEFRSFLESQESIQSKTKAVSSRVSKVKKAEEILGQSLDIVVADDDLMYESLLKLREYDREKYAPKIPLQHSVRKYYQFKNGREFPRLQHFKK